jgi:translation initiation factor IF-2
MVAAHTEAEKQMTDTRRTSSTHTQKRYTTYTTGEGGAPEKAAPAAAPAAARAAAPLAAPAPAQTARKRHSVAGGRIAAAGVGIAAMMGLVANMEVADGNAQAASPTKLSAVSAQRTAKGVRQGTPTAPGEVATAKVSKPIILTPHAVVNTVSAPSSGGSGGGGYAYSAPAPAAAPVASSGGS